MKHYLKLNKKVLRFDDLKKEVKKAIKKVKRENYKNYFLYAYKKNELHKAKKFKKLITSEVIPSIRKYGYYKLKNKYESDISVMLKKIM
jgi:hypothetical protein